MRSTVLLKDSVELFQLTVQESHRFRIRSFLRSKDISSALRTVKRVIHIAHNGDPDILKKLPGLFTVYRIDPSQRSSCRNK